MRQGSWSLSVLAMFLASCQGRSPSREADAPQCPARECPAGTLPIDQTYAARGVDVGVGVNPNSFDGKLLYRSFGSGTCKYACAVAQQCPANTVPLITKDCFTCAQFIDGKAVAPQCGVVAGAHLREAPPTGRRPDVPAAVYERGHVFFTLSAKDHDIGDPLTGAGDELFVVPVSGAKAIGARSGSTVSPTLRQAVAFPDQAKLELTSYGCTNFPVQPLTLESADGEGFTIQLIIYCTLGGGVEAIMPDGARGENTTRNLMDGEPVRVTVLINGRLVKVYANDVFLASSMRRSTAPFTGFRYTLYRDVYRLGKIVATAL